jgi:hypothetical protein
MTPRGRNAGQRRRFMLEKDPVQQRGFHNVYKGGKAVGFQVRFRSTYYRGIWLSMSTGFEVTVDGEKFSKEQVEVTVGGRTYTQAEMTRIGSVQWPNYEAAILTVARPGGLKPGVHDVAVAWGHRTSYIPGGISMGRPSPARKLVLVY